MQRSDFAFAPLSLGQYESIISAGEIFTDDAGNRIVSPLHGQQNYDAAMAVCQQRNVDLRVLLAALQAEDHFGTDPAGGVELATVFNFGGIIFASQPGAFRSDVLRPLNERPDDPQGKNDSSHYAGFSDFGGFVAELIRTLNNVYCGPAFRAGDLVTAWAIYVGGPNNPNVQAGQSRVDQWQYYLLKYPPQGDAPMPDGVYGEDLIKIMASHLNESTSDGTLDSWNAPHEWAGWCQASVEGVRAAAGLDVVHRVSAADQLDAVIAQGLLQLGRPEHGGIVMWGRTFDPSGHTCLWDDDKGMFLSTLYNPSRIGYYYSDAWFNAMAGWWRAPGVVAARRTNVPVPAPSPVPDFWLIDDNPYGKVAIRMPFWARWDQLNTMGTKLDHAGAVNPAGLALPMLGYAMEPETTLPTGRRIQRFERGWLATDKGADPFDCVVLTLAERP